MYCIGTGSKYIAAKPDNTLYVTDSLDEARLYSNAQRAGNALVTLPRRFYEISSKWVVRQVLNDPPADEEKTPVKAEEPTSPLESTFETSSDEDNNGELIDFLGVFNSVADLKQCKNGCLTKLNSELSRLSEEITDIEHYIEFSKLNAPDAYRAYKMLRDTLQERRRIKDSIIAVSELYKNCDVDKIAASRDQMSNRVYAPRRLMGLFSDGVK